MICDAGGDGDGGFAKLRAIGRREDRHTRGERCLQKLVNIQLGGGLFHQPVRVAQNFRRHQIGAEQRLAQLRRRDIAGFLIGALVDLPAHKLRAALRAGEKALRRPRHPFAIRAAEQGDKQLAALQVPQPHGLAGAAGDEIFAIGRRRDGPDIAFMADEITSLLALAIIGGKPAVAAARDDGLAIEREAIGAMFIAIRRVAGDRADRALVLHNVENGLIAIGPTLAMGERPAVEAGERAAEGAALLPGQCDGGAKRVSCERQG